MDIPTILIRIAGVLLFGWTVRSLVLHINEIKKSNIVKKDEVQSVSEKTLNNALFYVWLLFMFAFSIGMLVNN